jgi:hypothetical protein
MKLSELIEIEKSLRELVYYEPGADRVQGFFNLQNEGAKALGILIYEIRKLTKEIKVEVKNDTL